MLTKLFEPFICKILNGSFGNIVAKIVVLHSFSKPFLWHVWLLNLHVYCTFGRNKTIGIVARVKRIQKIYFYTYTKTRQGHVYGKWVPYRREPQAQGLF